MHLIDSILLCSISFFFFFPQPEHLKQWCAAQYLTSLAEDGGQRQGLGFSSACTAGIPTMADFMLPPT